MKKLEGNFLLFFVIISFLLLNASIVNAAFVEPKIEEELDKKPEVSVIVVLEDDYKALRQYAQQNLKPPKDELEVKKMMIKEKQEEFFKTVDGIEEKESKIKIKNIYSTVNGFAATVNEQGLEELKNNPNIKAVYEDRPVYLFLSDSKKIVNASKVGPIFS